MIDLRTEQLKTKNQARRLPWMKGRFGNEISLCTLERWCTKGIGGVILETVKIGGTVFTNEEATLNFIDRLNCGVHQPQHVSHSRQQQKAKADQRLDELGV